MARYPVWLLASLLGLLALLWAGMASAGDGPAPGRTFYVSATGDDAAAGDDPARPWRSLDRVSRQPLGPGDAVRFRAGDSFAGQLVIAGSGSAGRPVRIGRYGEGAKPIIDGAAAPGGGYTAAVLARNRHHIEIADLEITNAIATLRPGEAGDRAYGIHIVNDGGTALGHFRLTGLTIRDIYSRNIAHATEDAFNSVVISGIRFEARTSASGAPSSFRDITISGNLVTRTGRFGVLIGHDGGRGGNADADARDPETGFNQNIVIRANRFVETGGSGVQLGGARLALIEDNDFDRTGSSVVPDRMVGRGSGAWVINSRDIVAQHNRSRHVRGYKDSYGMHVDFGNRDILFQYNTSYDSEGGFVEILGNNRNIIWRYNISINDGLREKDGNTIWLSTWSPGQVSSDGIYIYNNTVFVRPGLYPDLDFRAKGVHVWNNIFHVSRMAMIGERTRIQPFGTVPDVAGNLYAGRINPKFRALDASGREGDALFVLPGSDQPAGYRLSPGSPAAAAGIAITHPPFPAAGRGIFSHVSAVPTVDYFGRKLAVGRQPAVGAAEAPPAR